MKTLLAIGLILGCATVSRADWYNQSRPQKDVWGNSYKIKSNLDKDSDGDGVSNRFDYNDRNKNIQRKGDVDYTYPGSYNKSKYKNGGY